MPVQLPGGMTREQYWAAQAAARPNTTGVNLRSSDGSHFDSQDTYAALINADPRHYGNIRSGNPGALTQSDLERNAEQSGQWYGSPADTRYAGQYYSANPRQRIEIQSAAEQARTTSLENARKAFAGLNPDGTPMARQPQAYVQPHAGAANGYDNLYASNDTAYDRPEAGMDFNPMQVQQQAQAKQQRLDQMNAAGRANVLQRFNNANQRLSAMGATANMPRINDVGYGGSARGALPPNKSGQGGINNTALMGPGARPTFRYGVSQNISMPRGSSPGTMGYGGSAMPTMQNFGGNRPPVQFGGQSPPGMYSQGWQSNPTGGASGGMTAQMPGGYPGTAGGMSGRPDMMRFGQPQQPRQFGPQGISPYVR